MSDVKISIQEDNKVSVKSNKKINQIAYFLQTTFSMNGDLSDFTISYQDYLQAKDDFFFYLENSDITYEIDNILSGLTDEVPRYDIDKDKAHISEDKIQEKISSEGFTRKLTENQIRNLSAMCRLKCTADFSVPGAGKTTEAIAFYLYHRKNKSDKLLVISPINAFKSWTDELKECLTDNNDMVRLRGDANEIEGLLNNSQKNFFITNFNTLWNPDKHKVIESFLIENPGITIAIDESHKMKGNPDNSRTAHELLKLAPLSKCKIIMTGTPMPQGEEDLTSQFNFLYPSEHLRLGDNFIDKFQSIYVRTKKDDLGLYPIKFTAPHLIKPYPAFEHFYQNYILKSYKGMQLHEIMQVSSFKKAVLKLLNVMSNPSHYLEIFATIDSGLYKGIKEEGHGAKFDKCLKRIEQIVEAKEKVLVWTSFSYPLQELSNELTDLGIGNVAIKGGMPSSNQTEDDDEDSEKELLTREKAITQFQTDPDCMVMIANPGAAAESMSLHKVCDRAIYLDRTFNASHYLQSQDRIHRLIEKEKERKKTIEIIQLDTKGSLDFRVDQRLTEKINYMGKFLNDSSLENLKSFRNRDSVAEDGQVDDDLNESNIFNF